MRKREKELPLNDITEFQAINNESSFNDLFILIDMVIIKKLLKNSFEEEAERSTTKSN